MSPQTLETDYLVIGAGAMGMAFVDELMTQSPTERVILVDKHAQPGGHWNDVYSFVSLHQPAVWYGVNSEKLGSGGGDLASGPEIVAYYARVLGKLLDTGRLRHFPMCEYQGDGTFVSIVASGREYRVSVRKKTVDATYSNVRVPSMHAPAFPVSEEVTLIPLNGLVDVREPQSGYVIIGGGKTGMDAVLFLLDQEVDPDTISWIVPNDAWLLDRAHLQPGRISDAGADAQLGYALEATSVRDFFETFEANGRIFRLDPEVWPTRHRCATVSLDELEQLRRVRNVVRMGRVERIDATAIVLRDGTLNTDSKKLHVDCTGDGLARREVRPVFDGDAITLQPVFLCQPTYSAAAIGYVETRFDTDEHKNALCQVVPHPQRPREYVEAYAITLNNWINWSREMLMWMRKSRLSLAHHEPLLQLMWSSFKNRNIMPRAVERMRELAAQEEG